MTVQNKEPGSVEPLTREAAFWKAMEGRRYGDEERRDAQGWFNTGWEAARAAHQAPQVAWRCFHCDEVFTTEAKARQHFGMTDKVPARCAALMTEVRRLKAELVAAVGAQAAEQGEPSIEELSVAWTRAISLCGIPGAGTEALIALQQLRNRRCTWFGEDENRLRVCLDDYLAQPSPPQPARPQSPLEGMKNEMDGHQH